MMKKLLLTSLLLSLVWIMTACGGEEEDSKKSSNPSDTDIDSQVVMNMDDMLEKMKDLDYTAVDFDVLYSDKEFEGELQNDEGLIEAEFYHPNKNIDARGSQAFDVMLPIVKSLKIDPNMTDTEAIAAAIESFNLTDDFLKAELEIVFSDGREMKFALRNDEM